MVIELIISIHDTFNDQNMCQFINILIDIIYECMLTNFFLFLVNFICSNVQNATSFQHMARMMDSLILNDFPPYTFTKITTTHRPVRTNNGMTTSKLLAKSTANISSASANLNNNNNNNSSVASVLGMNNGLRQSSLQKTKVPMQGLHSLLIFDFADFYAILQ